MTSEERAQIFEQLSTVLISDFQKNFHTVLAEAFTATTFTPEQANNEIRNALLHCARVCASDTVEDARKNIEQTRWHINLAVRDCFQICILQMREDIMHTLEVWEYRYGTIKHADREHLRAINSKVAELLKKELDPLTRQDENLTSAFEEAYMEICDFYKHIAETFPPTVIRRNVWLKAKIKAWRFVDRLGRVVIGFVIVAILSSSFMPASVKEYYNQGVKYLFCRIASDISCK